jgi:DNA-directed RNA polymerase subunit RPC12/RpoP
MHRNQTQHYSGDRHQNCTFRIMLVMKVETGIASSITMSLIGYCDTSDNVYRDLQNWHDSIEGSLQEIFPPSIKLTNTNYNCIIDLLMFNTNFIDESDQTQHYSGDRHRNCTFRIMLVMKVETGIASSITMSLMWHYLEPNKTDIFLKVMIIVQCQ